METKSSQIAKKLALHELETYFSIVRPPFDLEQIRAFQLVYQRLYPSLNKKQRLRLDVWAELMEGTQGNQAAEVQQLPGSRRAGRFFGVCRRLELGAQLDTCLDGLI